MLWEQRFNNILSVAEEHGGVVVDVRVEEDEKVSPDDRKVTGIVIAISNVYDKSNIDMVMSIMERLRKEAK